MEMKAIGVVHTPFTGLSKMPAGPYDFSAELGVVEVFPSYSKGLKDLNGFSHVIIITSLHRSTGEALLVVPPSQEEERGVFATRSPARPNHLGLTVVELVKVKGRNVVVRGVDLLDGTPLVDIKPYLPSDCRWNLKVGWLRGAISIEESILEGRLRN
jgi:tRNA-Thr(GGU) m(6)t(6)A37 methyltransferase TsaA